MKANLTRKENLFLKAYLEGKQLAECALYAGSKGKDNNSLRVIGYEILTRLNISLPELLQMQGLTDKFIAEKLDQGLNAKRPIVATWQGKITDEKFYDDPPTQAKYLELLGKMKGAFIDKLELTGKDAGDLVLQITPAQGKKKKKTISLD